MQRPALSSKQLLLNDSKLVLHFVAIVCTVCSLCDHDVET